MKKIVIILVVVFLYNLCFGNEKDSIPKAKAQNHKKDEILLQHKEKEVKMEKKLKKSKEETKFKYKKFVGIVESVDVEGLAIKVRGIDKKEEVKTFSIGSDVKIRINGKDGKLEEIKPDTHIIIKYEFEDEKLIVKSIYVQEKKYTKEKRETKKHKVKQKIEKKESLQTQSENNITEGNLQEPTN